MNEVYFKRCRRLLECQVTKLTKEQGDELKKLIERKVNAPEAKPEPNSTRGRAGAAG